MIWYFPSIKAIKWGLLWKIGPRTWLWNYLYQNYKNKYSTTYMNKTQITDTFKDLEETDWLLNWVSWWIGAKSLLHHFCKYFWTIEAFEFPRNRNGVSQDSMSYNQYNTWVFSSYSVLSDPGKCLQVPLVKVTRLLYNKHFQPIFRIFHSRSFRCVNCLRSRILVRGWDLPF